MLEDIEIKECIIDWKISNGQKVGAMQGLVENRRAFHFLRWKNGLDYKNGISVWTSE